MMSDNIMTQKKLYGIIWIQQQTNFGLGLILLSSFILRIVTRT